MLGPRRLDRQAARRISLTGQREKKRKEVFISTLCFLLRILHFRFHFRIHFISCHFCTSFSSTNSWIKCQAPSGSPLDTTASIMQPTVILVGLMWRLRISFQQRHTLEKSIKRNNKAPGRLHVARVTIGLDEGAKGVGAIHLDVSGHELPQLCVQ